MRVLMTADTAGGVWVYATELTDRLRGRGHDVVLVALGPAPSDSQRRWVEARRNLSFHHIDAPLEWEPEPTGGLERSAAELRRRTSEIRPDVVHLNQYYYGDVELGVPSVVVAHSDVLTWWRHARGEEPPSEAWLERYRGWVEAGLRRAAARVAPSRWLAAEIERTYRGGPVRTLHNGLSLDSGTQSREWRRDPPWSSEPLVLGVGRLWDEGKGAADLARAADLLAGRARFVLAGETRHPAGGSDFLEDTSAELPGPLAPAATRALMRRAAVYAGTSRYEPFGLAPLEAALCGCALVLSDIPTFRELWDGCAVFYPPGDACALAETIGGVLEDGRRRARLAALALVRARRDYGAETMTAGYEALYREVVGT